MAKISAVKKRIPDKAVNLSMLSVAQTSWNIYYQLIITTINVYLHSAKKDGLKPLIHTELQKHTLIRSHQMHPRNSFIIIQINCSLSLCFIHLHQKTIDDQPCKHISHSKKDMLEIPTNDTGFPLSWWQAL